MIVYDFQKVIFYVGKIPKKSGKSAFLVEKISSCRNSLKIP
jgi:hypothetical protein